MLQTANDTDEVHGTRTGQPYRRKGSMYEDSSVNDLN